MLFANLLRRRCSSSLPLLLGTIVVLWFCSSHHVAATGSKVEYLPGVQPEGPLPFELETGYIGVGESEDIQLFYYFVKSESNPSIDPIVLWISGGPGCSSFVAMTQELGPLLFDIPNDIWTTLPTLSLNPYSWTKVASFIFLDLPVRTGFSYVKSSKNYTVSDVETSYHAADFIRKWLEDHFQYQSNSFYVGGDSNSGFTVPMAVQAISYATGSKVKYLPGVQPEGPLPFELETGYIGVGKSEDIQLFYYFVKSESNPSIDPIVLWISGGPGCSSFVAMTEELGPLLFDVPKNNWSLPTLSLNPYSWTKVASFIFLDLPVRTGFSYAKSSKNYTATDVETSYHAAEFIRKWLEDHIQYQSNSFYVGGDSYSGITVPMVVQAISDGIDAKFKPLVNLKGYLIGNGVTFKDVNFGDTFRTARGLGLVSMEQYTSAEACKGTDCLDEVGILMTGEHYYWPNVIGEENDAKRFRGYNVHAFDRHLILKAAVIASRWMNHDYVLEALHVRKGCGEKWAKCRIPLHYERTVHDTRPYHANLSTKGYRSLIYSGNADVFVNSFSTERWTKSLNYSVIDDWRPWLINNRIVGYTRTFSNNMTYAKILGSDHVAPTITPADCFIMFKRWISHEKL